MDRQSLKWDQWLIVNDSLSDDDYDYHPFTHVVRRKQGVGRLKTDPKTKQILKGKRQPELASICENWLTAIPKIKGDKIIVVEDDDWYHPEYIARLSVLLDDAELVGVNNDLYFNLRTRTFRRCHNLSHCSLAATAFRPSLLPRLKEIAERGSVWLDMPLWDEGDEPRLMIDNKASDGRPYHVGLKGMPPSGTGLGMGHDGSGSSDKGLNVLTQWVGIEDSRLYRSIPATAWTEAT